MWNWEKIEKELREHKGFHFVMEFLVGLIIAIVTYFTTKSFSSSFVAFIATLIFTEFLSWRLFVCDDIINTIKKLIHCNPLLIDEFEKLLEQMKRVEGQYGTVLDFSRSVIKDMIAKHFVMVFQEPAEYRNNIEKLIQTSRKSIEGTCTVRPKYFLVPRDVTAKIDLEKKERRSYLKQILSANVTLKRRIVVLTVEEILGVIQDCVEAIESSSDTNGKDLDIPEIQWFVCQANGNTYESIGEPKSFDTQKIKLFWTEHEQAIRASDINKLPRQEYKIGDHHVDEYALFDKQVIIKYLKENSWSKGILFMAWTGIPAMEQYIKPFELLERYPYREDDGIFPSFYKLVKGLNINKTLRFSNKEKEFDNKTPLEIYDLIIKKLKASNLKFKSSYKDLWQTF
jgi:hypothetical protein